MNLTRTWNGADGNKKQLTIGVIAAVLLISLGLYKGLTRSSGPTELTSPNGDERIIAATEHSSAITKAREKIKARGKERALESIAEHEAAISRDWNSEEIPDRLMAVGNLYQYQLGDPYAAIQNYRNLVENFPKHTKTAQAYIEMASCYERLGDEAQAEYIYKEMVNSLDPTLEHVKFAKIKLEEKKAY